MNDRETEHLAPEVEALFGLSGGRVTRGLERLQLAKGARIRAGRVAVLLAVVTWVPLFILAATESVAWGGSVQVPFIRDYLPYGQFLIAVPVLVLGELTVSRYLILAVAGYGRQRSSMRRTRLPWMKSLHPRSRGGEAEPSTSYSWC